MDVDELGRTAGADLRRTVVTDLDVARLRDDLGDLRLRRRREHVGLVAATVVVLLLATSWVAGRSGPDDAAPPAHPTPSGPRLTGNGPIVVQLSGQLRAFEDRPGPHLPPEGVRLPERTTATPDFGLSWSPDGTRLAGSASGITDTRTGGHQPSRLCPFGCFGVAWSPDGSTIAVGTSTGLDLVDVATWARATVVDGTVAEVTWSPDGSRLAYTSADGLSLVDRDGAHREVLVAAAGGKKIWSPAWSPNHPVVAYLGYGPSGPARSDEVGPLTVMTVSVTGPDAGVPHAVREVGSCFCVGFAPGLAWSPDGRQFAVVSYNAADSRDVGLHVVAADGTGLHLLVQGASGPPAWQPVAAQPDSSRTATTAATGSGP
jgi:hypothetical protein